MHNLVRLLNVPKAAAKTSAASAIAAGMGPAAAQSVNRFDADAFWQFGGHTPNVSSITTNATSIPIAGLANPSARQIALPNGSSHIATFFALTRLHRRTNEA